MQNAKRWAVLASVAVLAAANVATLSLLARSMSANTAQAEKVRALELRVSDFEKRERDERNISGRDLPAMVDRALGVAKTWQRLYEESDRPLEMGDRINGALVCRVDSTGVYTLNGSSEQRHDIRTLPAGIRSRAALGVLLSE